MAMITVGRMWGSTWIVINSIHTVRQGLHLDLDMVTAGGYRQGSEESLARSQTERFVGRIFVSFKKSNGSVIVIC
jgi:hypothetical protein